MTLFGREEACKLETPFHSTPIKFYMQQKKASVSVQIQVSFQDAGIFFFLLSFELPVRLAFFHIPVHDRPFLSTVVKSLSRLSQTELKLILPNSAKNYSVALCNRNSRQNYQLVKKCAEQTRKPL